MESQDKSLTTLLFKDGFPDEWKGSTEFQQYLADLCSFSVERLGHEPDRLAEERANVLESTKELAYDNYPTFIETAKCSREILQEFTSVEEHIGGLLTAVPPLVGVCEEFLTASHAINNKRKLNSLTLSRHTQLLEILEIPQVMETCVRNNYYEEALELRTHVRQMERKHASSVPIIQSIVEDVQKSSHLMLTQLLQQLRTNIQLPACLRVIGYLRRMEIYNETELRLKFLQARDTYLQDILSDIPNESAYQHLSKMIEVSRVHLFDIMTQYRAIFPDDDPMIIGQSSSPLLGGLFYQWVNEKICNFLQVLERDLSRGMAGRLDSILGQCMYFGLSFSRIGADFRPLLVPIFQRSVTQRFTMATKTAVQEFRENMKKFTLISPRSYGSGLPLAGVSSKQGMTLSPPQSLMDFSPLSQLTNRVIAGLNEIRQCAAIGVSPSVHHQLVVVMESVIHELCEYHRIERRSFSDKESEQFTHYCRVVVQDFLPHLVNCFNALFPPQIVNELATCSPHVLRCNTTTLPNKTTVHATNRRSVQFKLEFNLTKLVEPLKIMLPDLFANDLYIADSLTQHTPLLHNDDINSDDVTGTAENNSMGHTQSDATHSDGGDIMLNSKGETPVINDDKHDHSHNDQGELIDDGNKEILKESLTDNNLPTISTDLQQNTTMI